MPEHGERVEKALRGCAEAGVPETVDLWPSIRERTEAGARRKAPSRFRGLPRTRAGWAFAVLAALFVMTGAGYTAGGLVYARFQEELPGAEARDVGTEIGEERVIDEAKVTLEWAYADEEFVVIGYTVEDLREDRRNAGRPAQLDPSRFFVGKDDVGTGRGPDRRATLTDESGRELGMIDGTFEIAGPGDGPEVLETAKSNSAVFQVPKDLEPGRSHRFRLEMPLEEVTISDSMEEQQGLFGPAEGGQYLPPVEPKPPIGPFVFDFEVPVRPAPTVELGQKVEANGVEMTLERVVNSPARPQAVICFRPPDAEHEWHPMVETKPADREPIETLPLGNGCWSAPLYDREGGRSSVTVTAIDGVPTDERITDPGMMQPTVIPGPWKFEFEVPIR